MKKIGIIIKTTQCDKYLYETIQKLAQSNQVSLFFLISEETKQQSAWEKITFRLKTQGLLRLIAFITFKI